MGGLKKKKKKNRGQKWNFFEKFTGNNTAKYQSTIQEMKKIIGIVVTKKDKLTDEEWSNAKSHVTKLDGEENDLLGKLLQYRKDKENEIDELLKETKFCLFFFFFDVFIKTNETGRDKKKKKGVLEKKMECLLCLKWSENINSTARKLRS
ncbi:hypothetical protein RFI_23981 [Reticulomyxa filosa]|uniref:Uncharacterized protein n=1 Tax=Reticulomyxa filosa TaxID=46433 RepID=X6MJ09_RETFI|nr:hypothetical protein RFI_23981 [Reticulomyxa filosa]|eukprot:ETO13392.1 hypothetical protein RFI_23981 [Reticulomyxa filosa]